MFGNALIFLKAFTFARAKIFSKTKNGTWFYPSPAAKTYLRSITATAATAAVFTTTSTATAGRAFFTRLGDVDREGATVHVLAVHAFDGFLGFLGGTHGDESESARTAGFPVHHHIGFSDRAERRKRVVQAVFSCIEGKISYE